MSSSPYVALLLALLIGCLCPHRLQARSSDMTSNVFANSASTAGIMAAFGDFNSDELTDVFTLKNDKRSLEIMLGFDVDPLLRAGPRCDFRQLTITSVVPGDFDGDAFMDVLITARRNGHDTDDERILSVYINWGGSDQLNCTDETAAPVLRMRGEPVALDYNRDMIIDLFGMDTEGRRTFWVFSADRQAAPRTHHQHLPDELPVSALSVPHSHAYLDLNADFLADLFVTTETHFEVWHGRQIPAAAADERDGGLRSNGTGTTVAQSADQTATGVEAEAEASPFVFGHRIELPTGTFERHVGQSLFLDVELNGKLNQVLPICFDRDCHNSTLLVHANGRFHDVQVNFKDGNGNAQWGFVPPRTGHEYLGAITLRGGDFNMDGYPDLLVTLARTPNAASGNLISKIWSSVGGAAAAAPTQTFLLDNVPCKSNCGSLTRTFEVRWRDLVPFTNGTVAGAFYDFYQDGILDVLFVEQTLPQSSRMVAFSNKLDYDANFIKCIVLTGLTNRREPTKLTPLGRKKRTYGTNMPGPRIEYQTTTQDGEPQCGTSAQLPQSGYFSLQLPYTIFGLGRTPNFVDRLVVGLANESRTWNQLIPNSQMIVVPYPLDRPSHWKAQLFVTPSKLIMKSVIALCAICVLIMLIILGLYIKEKRADKVEMLLQAHRFPFDAM